MSNLSTISFTLKKIVLFCVFFFELETFKKKKKKVIKMPNLRLFLFIIQIKPQTNLANLTNRVIEIMMRSWWDHLINWRFFFLLYGKLRHSFAICSILCSCSSPQLDIFVCLWIYLARNEPRQKWLFFLSNSGWSDVLTS